MEVIRKRMQTDNCMCSWINGKMAEVFKGLWFNSSSQYTTYLPSSVQLFPQVTMDAVYFIL